MFSNPIREQSIPKSESGSGFIFEDVDIWTGEALFSRMVERFSRVLLGLGILALLGSISRAWQSDWHPLFDVQIAFILIVFTVFLFRNRFKVRYTAVALITSLYAVSMISLLSCGPARTGAVLVLSGVPIITGAIYGRRLGFRAVGLVLVSFVFVMIGTLNNWWPDASGLNMSQYYLSAWLNIGMDMAVVSIGLILCVSVIQERLLMATDMNRAKNNFMQAIMDTQQDLFLVFEWSTGKPVYWNKAFREFAGLTDSEIQSRSVPHNWQDKVLIRTEELDAAVGRMLNGEDFLLEIPVIHHSRKRVPVEFRAAAVDLPDQERLIACIGRDVSERQDLRNSERNLSLITENIPVVVWAVDHGGKLVHMSSNVSSVCGFTAEELLQEGLKLWVTRIHSDDRPGYNESFMSLLHSGKTSDCQYRFTTKDGRTIWLHERAVLTSDCNAGEPAACGVFWDVTEQVKTAEHLRQSEKLRALGELAGGVAHDFNNQISIILGLAELLSHEKSFEGNARRYIDELRTSALNAAALPEQLLTFARKNPKDCVPLNVHDIINNTVSILSRSFSKRIKLNTQLDAQNPTVTTNPSQLQNALLNLCLNARDAMPEGGELTVSTRNGAINGNNRRESIIPGEFLFLSVRDTGEGMSEEIRQRIFEPFFTTKPEGKGTGMGMAMVFGFVKSLGGNIEVVSEPNRGTLMTLALPVYSKEIEPAARAKNKTVLLVDDEPSVLNTISSMLEDMGMNVVSCLSGEEAVIECKKNENNFALVITDMVMPRLNGSETAAKIRQIYRSIPVLFISARASDKEIYEAQKGGLSGYMPKPFSQPELEEKVLSVILPDY